jgi:putative sigma-54 modulation protein
MEIQIHVQVISLPRAAALRRHASAQLKAALLLFPDIVESVSVQLSDITGPERGGVDKLCRTVIRFRHSALWLIEELGSDMHQVIDRAADRVHECVSRQVSCRPT